MFDFTAWVDMTRQIPQEHIKEALEAVVERHRTLQREPEILAQEVQAATLWHERLDAQADGDGLRPWVKPTDKFDAYPPGHRTEHSGEEWVADGDRVVCGEPGVDPAWIPAVVFDARLAEGDPVPSSATDGEFTEEATDE